MALLALFVLFVGEARGYLKHVPSYSAQFEGSDLVVIAAPIERRELNETTVLPGVPRGGRAIEAVPIETTFRIIVTFKSTLGSADSTFVLLHHRFRQRPKVYTGGPALVDFEPSERTRYLMFLKARADGRFGAFTRVDPGDSIEELNRR